MLYIAVVPVPPIGYLECPPLEPEDVGSCVEACFDNDDCIRGYLCCYNGCGHTCQWGNKLTTLELCNFKFTGCEIKN